MRVVRSFSELRRERPAIVTIGAFDGVHRGHQFLIRQVIDRARRLEYDAVVITFDPRPQVLLRPGSTQLSAADEKVRIVRALGPSTLVVVPFSRELSLVPASQFLGEMLEGINIQELWVGADFAFGHNREGDVGFLIRAGQASGFATHVVTRQKLDGHELSSTAVRRFLEDGAVDDAARLLGHYFRVSGVVVQGAGRGAGLGYPTANLKVPATQTIPALGIYAAYAVVEGERFGAAVSVGTNPTFGDNTMTIEPYLLDFDGDLRDRALSLDFVGKLRDEVRFETADALVEQMDRDVGDVRRMLDSAQEPGELLLAPGE